ncbi:MAG: hypothetical protein AAF993_13025 [Pseudomonadota bacterium]
MPNWISTANRYPLTDGIRRRPGLALVVLVCLSLGACQSTPEPPPPEPEPPGPVLSTQQLNSWLDAAQQAIDGGRLIYPRETSALQYYQQILALDPEEAQATRGLENIVEIHIERALRALSRGYLATARSMLARARLILPDHPSIAPTEAQIQLIAGAQRTELTLNRAQVNGTRVDLIRSLRELATMPPDQACRFKIWASTDTQGRTIYQALSEAANQQGSAAQRLRAEIMVRSPAGVERLCFENQ